MPKHFIKVKEDFTCKHCKERVKGTGYTDHCQKCLWGKHVDEEVPGDRKSGCLGQMRPVSVEVKGGEYRIYYECIKCGKKKINKASKNDSFEEILILTTKPRR